MLLLDQNISYKVAKRLKPIYPGILHVREVGLLNADDPVIWQYAKANGLSIVTFDSDFMDISIVRGVPPKIIWIRAGNMVSEKLVTFLADYREAVVAFVSDKRSAELACLELR